jgi:hypothetical protein
MFDPRSRRRNKPVLQHNEEPRTREQLEAIHGQVWDTQELARDYIVIGFNSPLVAVRRKSDGVVGTLEFQHLPRCYFAFRPEEGEGQRDE